MENRQDGAQDTMAERQETPLPSSPDHLVVSRLNGVVRLTIPFGLTQTPKHGSTFADMWVSTVLQAQGTTTQPGSITLSGQPSLTDEMYEILSERFGSGTCQEIDTILGSDSPRGTVEVSEDGLRQLASTIALSLSV